ncbi:MAG: hypothetical protein SPI28_03045 [Acetatifactor sp.]|nr:hypothetical protein [Acetatifactor sp.]
MKPAIFLLLQIAFGMLFARMARQRLVFRMLMKTKRGLEDAARKRLLLRRGQLMDLKRKENIWLRLERELVYSGLSRRFPLLTPELFLVGNLFLAAAVFLGCLSLLGWKAAICASIFPVLPEMIFFQLSKSIQNRRVEKQLLKLLDFMGNYSITGGEITGVFLQVSRYLEEPLRGVLEEGCYEAQMTGDVSLALLSMSEQIAHPQFQELMRNLEISLRYSADLKVLVNHSRRSVREYIRASGEQKTMLQEAGINMLLLLGMSMFSVFCVSRLIGTPIAEILFGGLLSKLAVGVIGFIFCLFAGKILKLST